MPRSGSTPIQNVAPYFSPFSFGGNSSNTSLNKSRPGTSSGDQGPGAATAAPEVRQPNVLHKDRDRRPSGGRKTSFGSSPSRKQRKGSSASSATANGLNGGLGIQVATDKAAAVPALPDSVQSPTTNETFSRMLARTNPTPTSGPYMAGSQLAPPAVIGSGLQSESSLVHQHIQDIANKRISTLDYLRKAHEGRVYWFNALLFDKSELARMPYFDSRKLARRATNYLLLGLSLPTVIDLNSTTPLEFLRSLNTLLSEFDSFQALHPETGSSGGSLSRASARLPQMFRRSAAGGKARRASGAVVDSSSYDDAGPPPAIGEGVGAMAGASVLNFADAQDLLPGEEYTHLLTPSLPFDPDFFETFATLCDVLIDCYARLLSLVPTPRDCGGPVAELFAKADGKVRKIIIQGVVKEFEDSSRSGLKTEVANVGRVVLGGLM